MQLSAGSATPPSREAVLSSEDLNMKRSFNSALVTIMNPLLVKEPLSISWIFLTNGSLCAMAKAKRKDASHWRQACIR
jgi:hypothetical protein